MDTYSNVNVLENDVFGTVDETESSTLNDTTASNTYNAFVACYSNRILGSVIVFASHTCAAASVHDP